MTIDGIGYACALVLAVLYFIAAASKATSQSAVVESFARMGLRAPEVLAVAVPVLELATAVLLVLLPVVGATLSAMMLAGFTVVLARVMASGVPLGCACFGATSDEPVTVVELVRNAGLLALSLLALMSERVQPSLADGAIVLGVVGAFYLGLRATRKSLRGVSRS